MSKANVLLSEDIHPDGKAILKDIADLTLAPDTTEATAKRLVAECDGIVARASTPFTRQVIEAGERLRVIARTGVGYNNVDVEAATERGIPVCIVPGANAQAVAEHTLAMLLVLSKQVIPMDQNVRRGRWSERFSPLINEIGNKTLGLIGLGNIGRRTAQLALGCGMEVIGYDPLLPIDATPEGVTFVTDVNDVFRQADFVSLHVPVTDQTKGLVNAERLKLMKPSAYIINTSRSELIDDAALIAALEQNVIRGAAIDVYSPEPPPADHPLLSAPRVVVSPHSAGSTLEANIRLATGAAQAVCDVLEGRRPTHVVNPQVFEMQG